MRLVRFVERLSELSLENTFNPYAERCVAHDRDDAPQYRSSTLLKILERASAQEIDSIWIGRDLGYRGGRRTGLAFTDDMHFRAHAARWGLSASRPTKGNPVKERTAAAVWNALSRIEQSVFLWNVFPLHPHEPNNPFTNRSHNRLEKQVGEILLSQLVSILRPSRLIAIGKAAEQTAHNLGCSYKVVRHPSYGGQTEFLTQVAELYDLPERYQSVLFEQ